MKRDRVDTTAGRLARLIERLIASQEELLGVIHEKLEAMRRCEPQGMIAASRREGEVTATALELDEERRRVVGTLCNELGVKHGGGIGMVTLRALAKRLDSQAGAELVRLGDELRRRMVKVAEANRVVELVSREMLAHFKNMFAAFACDEQSPRTYSRGGNLETRLEARVLDATC